MGKKSIKCKMRKFNPIIFICLVITLTLAGCGMPGALYQTQEKPLDNNSKKVPSSKKQQEN